MTDSIEVVTAAIIALNAKLTKAHGYEANPYNVLTENDYGEVARIMGMNGTKTDTKQLGEIHDLGLVA